MSAFDDLFSRHVLTAMARQFALADVIGERDWAVDLGAGSVTFGNDLRFPIQLLGSESQGDNTWLWAWANEASNLPPALIHLCTWMRDYGRSQGIAELTDRTFPLSRADGHRLALLASGLTGRPYYRGPYEGGALFFHLEGVPPQELQPERALTVISQTISAFPFDHRTGVTAFFEQQGWPFADGVAHHPSGATMNVSFDDLGRISQLNGSIPPRG
ncbi:DUF6882 domain-containing protein [Paractinoplanes lichenicola]|uniref:Uncharacterized protein n=1 Tax=Paractinoplanes lichenicola TaxID=2802976 RepID=A0ABS1VWX1_9ACTN|nr:DUF6882 domain-containing protein [Actinoplanes lichenicola]MBL7258828.1 hypothetical protein [Actinoplanes lichenicola]